MLNESVGDSKTSWKVLKGLMGKKSGVTEVNEILISSDRTLSNAEPKLVQISVQTFLRYLLMPKTTSVVFTEIKPSRVLKLLSKLDVAKVTDLDQICNEVLKLQYSSQILQHLCDFPLPQCWLDIAVISVLQNTRGLTLGKERGTFKWEQRCEEWM